jgi:PRTRC genetic system protein B
MSKTLMSTLPPDDLADQLVRPVNLLAVYRSKDGVYLEAAEISDTGEPRTFQPLTQELAYWLAETLRPSKSEIAVREFIPEGVKFYEHHNGKITKILWVTPPQRRWLIFEEAPKEPTKSGHFNAPWLLWAFHHGVAWLYALDGPPQDKAKVYHAPFYNMWETGAVCMGDAERLLKGDSIQELVTNIQHTFWRTVFTHPHCNKLIRCKGMETMKQEYARLINSKKQLSAAQMVPLIPNKVELMKRTYPNVEQSNKQVTYGNFLRDFSTK